MGANRAISTIDYEGEERKTHSRPQKIQIDDEFYHYRDKL